MIKPDIVAPGNKIAAASAPGNLLVTLMPSLTNSTLNIDGTNNDMMYQSGTSMATPMAAGAAALLFQMNPKLTPTMVKMLLQYTSQSMNGVNMYEQGAGQLNVEGVVKLARTYQVRHRFQQRGSRLVTAPIGSVHTRGYQYGWRHDIYLVTGFFFKPRISQGSGSSKYLSRRL